MSKVVEITAHFLDEESGISGYVANNKVYLNLGDDGGVTREEFKKTAIKYVGFNVDPIRIKSFTDIYDDAQNQYTNVKVEKVEEVVVEPSQTVDVPIEVIDVRIDLDEHKISKVVEEPITKLEDPIKTVVETIAESPVEEPVEVEEEPVKQVRAVGRRGAKRVAKIKSDIKSKK